MNHEQKGGLSRRDFIRAGAAGATGIALSGIASTSAFADDTALGKLPRRRYGRTGLDISALVGASDWNPAVIPMAVQAGVNYWHKSQRWTAETMPAAIKSQPRESYHLECVVDRVGGDNMTGHIDEEQHYQFVKQCVQRSGVGYYDIFKFHFGYHSVAEAQSQEGQGIVRAYNRLKKEGLVKHLALSQHHYNNIGGQMAYEVIAYLVNNSPFEAAQFFYTYGDRKEIEDSIALAKKNDFGVIAMKTMGGVGRAAQDKRIQTMLAEPRFAGSTPGAAMVKWLMSNPNLTAAVIATKNFDQLQENMASAQQAPKVGMTKGDQEALGLLAAFNKGQTCLLCADCVSHCPEHIAIADILRYERYARDYDEMDRAKAEYATLTKNGTACIACGDCMPGCKADINIVAKLKEVHDLLG
ncbi:MAG TPA: aldo/keto reductase [Chthoniobacteraceae bacterium]|jgi:predicted aldo/keto reductase-like oxidoreductase|nr:aldo/keto reductase [Chthoniobacteraceae bacterium]